MTDQSTFPVEPWTITEQSLDLDLLGQTETIFALANGHIGLRGNLDEGEPHHTPGTYLNGMFEHLSLPYAEDGYGYPEEGQTLINVTNGKLFRLLVDDEPFDVRYGTLVSHERVLDMRAGTVERKVEWISPAGKAVRIHTTRLVSFSQRAVAAIRIRVEPVDEPVRIVLQSILVANEPLPEFETDDPRAGVALGHALVSEYHTGHDLEASLGHRTKVSELRMAAAMDHVVDGPEDIFTSNETEPDLARVTLSADLLIGEHLDVVKYLAYGWSGIRSMPAIRDQVDAALASARHSEWDGLVDEQREFLDRVWETADVEIEGDDELQQAVRFAIFQVVQATARAERRAIPAKGLSSRGYDGHTFWDMESFVMPMVTYTAPKAARDALLWRHSTLDLARDRASELRLKGATFPWRTIQGEECSAYWPAGTAAFHINSAIADAVRRYVAASGDEEFHSGPGLELLIETARLWRSLGHHDAEGRFRIDGVTGPDEYTAVIDNNVYTNLMAARNFRAAADAVRKFPEQAAEFGADDEEIATWRDAAENVVVPFDDELGVTMQSEGFTRYRHWDFKGTPKEEYPLLLHYPYYLLYSSQVIKQADLVLALYLCGDSFTPEQKRRDFEYYEAITVRDSSLSASTQAIVAAEVGHLQLALTYFKETAFVDLHNLAGNTEDGIHLAAMGGAWLVAVAGFGGMRDYGERLAFAPQLPPPLTQIRFRMIYQGRLLRITINGGTATYEILEGEPLEIDHHGERVTIGNNGPETLPCPPCPNPREAVQPHGRGAGEKGVGVETDVTALGMRRPRQ
ncbi:MAG TPA: glycosyl hydrolase family 65 protein [Thermomicrobiales bacterium]|nr:glycosyl hydrolase family 65 protein [Thermomicrobiales bacterium]